MTIHTRPHATATPAELSGVAWHISTRSTSGGGNCVEAGPFSDLTGRVAVRHSHQDDGPTLIYSTPEWTTFTHALKSGTFDFPLP